MCNKRPLHQPASSSYCSSAHREPGNPSNHGRAEKAGAYSSLPLFPGLPPPSGSLVSESILTLQAVGSTWALSKEEAAEKDRSVHFATSLNDILPVASRALVK